MATKVSTKRAAEDAFSREDTRTPGGGTAKAVFAVEDPSSPGHCHVVEIIVPWFSPVCTRDYPQRSETLLGCIGEIVHPARPVDVISAVALLAVWEYVKGYSEEQKALRQNVLDFVHRLLDSPNISDNSFLVELAKEAGALYEDDCMDSCKKTVSELHVMAADLVYYYRPGDVLARTASPRTPWSWTTRECIYIKFDGAFYLVPDMFARAFCLADSTEEYTVFEPNTSDPVRLAAAVASSRGFLLWALRRLAAGCTSRSKYNILEALVMTLVAAQPHCTFDHAATITSGGIGPFSHRDDIGGDDGFMPKVISLNVLVVEASGDEDDDIVDDDDTEVDDIVDITDC